MNPPLTYLYIDTAADLCREIEKMRLAGVIGIDCEADSLHSYEEKVSLIQISGNHHNLIIDPLAIGELSPVDELLRSPEIVKVLHGMEYDVVALNRDFGIRIASAFDTCLAARACGYEKYSLAHLLHRFFGIHADKKYQKVNWSSRPLPAEWLQYAAMDTHYLPELYDILTQELKSKDRLEIVEEESQLITQRDWTGKAFHADDYLRIKGAAKLGERQQRVARALAVARDRLARDLNRPAFKVLGDQDLISLASKHPNSERQLAELYPNKNHSIRRRAEHWLSGIREGFKDETPLPALPKKRGPRPSGNQQALFDSLRSWRVEQSRLDSLEPALVLSIRQIRQLIEAVGPQLEGCPATTEDLCRFPFLRRWQIRRYGPQLLEKMRRPRPA